MHTATRTLLGVSDGACAYLTIVPSVISLVTPASMVSISGNVGVSIATAVGISQLSVAGAVILGAVTIFGLPTLLVSIITGVKMYRDTQKRNAEERDYLEKFNREIKKFQEKRLIQAKKNLMEAMYLCKHYPIDLSLIKVTLRMIECIRTMIADPCYEEDVYQHLRKRYDQFNPMPYNPKCSVFTPIQSHEEAGLFLTLKNIVQEVGDFFGELHHHSKTHSVKSAVGLFFSKTWNRAYSFFGGAGVVLTIGAVVLAFTGVGLPAAIGLSVTAVGVGFATSAVNYYTTRKQEKRIQAIQANLGLLEQTKKTGMKLSLQVAQSSSTTAMLMGAMPNKDVAICSASPALPSSLSSTPKVILTPPTPVSHHTPSPAYSLRASL